MDTRWRHLKISEKLGRCGRQNMLWLYLKIWDWDWIFGRAVKAISFLGVRSPCTYIFKREKFRQISFQQSKCFAWWQNVNKNKILNSISEMGEPSIKYVVTYFYYFNSCYSPTKDFLYFSMNHCSFSQSILIQKRTTMFVTISWFLTFD